MALGFNTMNNIQVYGDGNGNIVIEEWASDKHDDEQNDLVGRVVLSVDRFELVVDLKTELISEAWSGIK
jgi:hypothetical protein